MRLGRGFPARPFIRQAVKPISVATRSTAFLAEDELNLQQSTAANVPIFMVLASDHVTGATGKALTITLSKNGAAFATITPTVTELGNGWYNLALTSSHTDTTGALGLHVTASACDAKDERHQVVNDIQVSTYASSNFATFFDNNAATSTAVVGRVDTTISSRAAPSDVPTAAANAAGLLDLADAVESGLTVRKAWRLMAAALAGKLSGAGTGTIAVRNAVADTKTRITYTVDSSNNRTAVTTDLT